MASIGSVFLGDVQRHRILSNTSTPPSSPPPSSPPPSSISAVFPSRPSPKSQAQPRRNMSMESEIEKPTPPASIDPALALDLRLRWLEALLLGVNTARDKKGKDRQPAELAGSTLSRTAEDLQRRLDAVVEGNDGLKRFMAQYDQHAHLLTPAFALSGATDAEAPAYDALAPEQLEAFLAEMEADIRAADRDMREIELLQAKGVMGAGRLASYEELQPRLIALLKAHQADVELIASLERRTAALMEQHATQVDALSELFVAWDDTITVAEQQTTKLERQRAERIRLGRE
ncbi:hypothetical protein H0H81_001703 [Sphagnurus paluster]|uniref:Uncharacterized protein n=1 Tax=Sphagnurus paluster TaxID=117069 RepID=A0A9P7FSE3_9AGAR|nr:hypothetical protein H0H81_001703 [Sphagnurus paluster]